jgi:hypothetical protein
MRRIVLGCLGTITGFLLGWPLVVCWAALTGNLVMSKAQYEERGGFIKLVIWLIVGTSSLLGGVLAASLTRRRHVPPRRDHLPDSAARG